MMYPLGTHLKSTYDSKINGIVVGYGTISWPSSKSRIGDEYPQSVYLLQVQNGGSSIYSHACHVVSADHAAEVK